MSGALAVALFATTMRLVASHAYPDGAPPGFSGGFKEDSCHACHFDAEPNAGPGRVTLEGVPARFAAGERYTVTISLRHADMKLAGFQLAARFTEGGGQAGTIAPGAAEADRVGVETHSGVQYAGQKKAGSALAAADVAQWTVVWTAPKESGAVTFHIAANAANGNESTGGDFVYIATVESAPP